MWTCLYISTSFFNISASLGLFVKLLSRLKMSDLVQKSRLVVCELFGELQSLSREGRQEGMLQERESEIDIGGGLGEDLDTGEQEGEDEER